MDRRKWRFLAAAAVFALGCDGSIDGETAPSTAVADASPDDAVEAIADAVAETVPSMEAAVDTAVVDSGAALVPMFIAQGKLGRTTVSCDDGHTWIADRSENPEGRCWDSTSPNNVECDHDEWSSLGVLSIGTHVLATYGWGHPGVVRRTEDGITWEDVFPGHSFAGLAFGNGRVVANDRTPWASTEKGAPGSWKQGGDVSSPQWNVRHIGFVPPKRFVVSLESAEPDVVYSDDDLTTFVRAATRPAGCGHWVSDILHGNDVTVMVQNDGTACRSTDGGATWTITTITTAFTSNALFVDGAFVVWNGSTRYRSTDGQTWTSEVGTDGVTIGAVARADDGTFAAVRGGWDVWYEKQRFYRSTDGVHWDTLPAGAYTQSHPITHMTFARVKPSKECPGT